MPLFLQDAGLPLCAEMTTCKARGGAGEGKYIKETVPHSTEWICTLLGEVGIGWGIIYLSLYIVCGQ